MALKMRAAALCVLLAMVCGILPGTLENKAIAAKAGNNVAEVVFNSENPEKKGFKVVEPGTDKIPQLAERGGEPCWLMDKLQGNNKSTINFTLDETMKEKSFDGSVYDIEIDYFDSGKGFFVLYYVSQSGATEWKNIAYTNATNAWKTAKFTISDADFTGKANGGYDFYLSIKALYSNSHSISPESMAIGRIKVTRHVNQNKLFISAKVNEPGNTFKWYAKEKLIDTTVQNLSGEDTEAQITFRAVTDSGFVKAEKVEKVSLLKDESRDITVDLGEACYCDKYYLEAEVKMADGTTFTQRPTMFVIIKTDPDGKKNKSGYLAAHFDRYTEESRDEAAKMIAMANFGGVRESIDPDKYDKVMPYIIENDLKYLPIVWCLPASAVLSFASNWWSEMPHTDAQYAAWREKVRATAELMKDHTDRYAIWNEVNLPGFNRDIKTTGAPMYFAKTVQIAKEVIEEVDPGAKVACGAWANMWIKATNENTGKAYFDEMLKYDLIDYTDAVDLHPYSWSTPEAFSMVESIKYYRDTYRNAGKTDVEVWNTEFGYTTADNVSNTERKQGELNQRTLLIFEAEDVGDINVLYNFERKGIIDYDREDSFGMVENGYDDATVWGTRFFPREGYIMLAGHNYVMADSTNDKIIESTDPDVVIYQYDSKKFDSKIVTVYDKQGNSKTVSFDLGTDKIDLYDAWGNMTELYSESGCYTFDIDSSPIYIVGDITKVEETEKAKESTKSINSPYNDTFYVDVEKTVDKDLKIEVELPKLAELVEISDFENNKARVKIRNYADVGESFDVVLKLKDGDKTVYERTYTVTSNIPAIANLSASPATDDYFSWSASLKLKNLASERAMTGHLEFKEGELTKNLKNVDIGLIPAGCTGLVEFSLGRIAKKGLYPIEFDLVTDDGNRYSFANTFDMSFAKYAENKPVIDGNVGKDEWSFGTAMVIDTKSSIKQINDWRGVNDLSGKCMVMWDEDNFYFAAEVTDDVFTPAEAEESQWKGDDIQIGIYYGETGLIALGQGSSSYHEIGLAKTVDGDQAWRWSAQDDSQPTGRITDLDMAVVRKGTKTYYEAKIPWSTLLKPNQQPQAGHEMAFTFLFNDNDGTGRRGWMEYTPGVGETKNTQLFSRLKLMGKDGK